MPAAIDHPAVREQVRALYFSNGRNLTLAAATAGVPYRRAQKWLQRGEWDSVTDDVTRQSDVSQHVSRVADNAANSFQSLTKLARHELARVALASVRKVKSVPAKSAKDIRDLAGTVETIDPQRDGSSPGITLNVLNVAGDMNCSKS